MNIGFQILGMAAARGLLQDYADFAKGGTTTYVVGTDVEYAPYVEFGTSRMAAQPYMRPAAEEVRGNAVKYLTQAGSVEGAVQAAALDVERKAKTHCPVDTGNLRGSIRAVKQ